MKVQNITDVEGFFKVVDSCKGRVELVTGEGDRLNLKSKLSQYVSMANIFSNGEIPELKDAILAVMKDTRHYAKRQLTWLKRYEGLIHWIEIQRNESVGAVVDRILSAE